MRHKKALLYTITMLVGWVLRPEPEELIKPPAPSSKPVQIRLTGRNAHLLSQGSWAVVVEDWMGADRSAAAQHHMDASAPLTARTNIAWLRIGGNPRPVEASVIAARLGVHRGKAVIYVSDGVVQEESAAVKLQQISSDAPGSLRHWLTVLVQDNGWIDALDCLVYFNIHSAQQALDKWGPLRDTRRGFDSIVWVATRIMASCGVI